MEIQDMIQIALGVIQIILSLPIKKKGDDKFRT
jgi:hypothetical protein